MSTPYPQAVDRRNDPEPYAPLLGSQPAAGTSDANVSQYTYNYDRHGHAQGERPYVDHPPARSPEDAHRDPFYAGDERSPYGQAPQSEGKSEGRSPYATHDPFATQESLNRDQYGQPLSQAPYDPYAAPIHDPYATAYDSRPLPPGQNHDDNGGDIELRPLNQKSKGASRFLPAPGPLSTTDTILFATGLDRIFRLCRIRMGESAEQVIQRRRRGLPGQRYPVLAYLLTIIMCCVMVYELVENQKITGSAIATKPYFNWMIGPSSGVLINIGARFAPCMRLVESVPPTMQMVCPADTSSTPSQLCTVETICGHGGFANGTPDQSWRFFTPIFLHVGVIHLALNMFAQIAMGGPVERMMGSIPWLIVYIGGGLYGNILGGSFSLPGIPSAGASGAIFAMEACAMIDLALHWKYEERPRFKAMMFALELVLIIAMGYIPFGVDGLAHLGGLAMGLLLGIILVPSTPETPRYRMIVMGCRLVALPLAILAFALTTKNFYTDDPNAACTWCKYLSCIPTSSNNNCNGSGLTTTQINNGS